MRKHTLHYEWSVWHVDHVMAAHRGDPNRRLADEHGQLLLAEVVDKIAILLLHEPTAIDRLHIGGTQAAFDAGYTQGHDVSGSRNRIPQGRKEVLFAPLCMVPFCIPKR